MRRLLLIALLASFAGVSPRAEACKCSGPGTVEESRGKAAFVVLGRVISSVRHFDEKEARRRAEARDFSHGPWYGQELVIEPIRSWKRRIDKRFSLWTGFGGGDCGFMAAREGQVYILYVYEVNGQLETNSCTRSRFAACGGSEVLALGKPDWTHPRVPLDALRFDEFAPLPLLECMTPPVLEDSQGWLLEEPRGSESRITIDIDRAGSVIRAKSPEHPGAKVDESIREAAMHWRFKPATLDGRAVAARVSFDAKRAK